jgi:hypothetical protein
MSKADEEDIKLCKETCKQFLGHFGKKKTSLHSLLERKSSAANSLLKGTMGRAYLRIGKDRAVEVDSSSLTEVTEVESLFSYKANFSVGGAKFELKFKNNSKSHKIERLWVGPRGGAIPKGGEFDSSLVVLFKEGYEPDKNDFEFDLYARPKARSSAYKAAKLHFGDEHLLTINAGKPLAEIAREKFDVLAIRRYHRDKVWILIFLLYWAIEIGVASHAVANGRLDRVLHGVDSLGNICGSNNDLVDLTDRPKLWYPNPEENRAICVKVCPVANQTALVDYLANIAAPNGTAPPLRVTVGTVDVSHRCLPIDGQSASIMSASATLFSDVQSGWVSSLLTCVVAFLLGLLWMKAMLWNPRGVIGSLTCVAHSGLLLFSGSFFVSYFVVELPEGLPASAKSHLVDPSAQTFAMVVGIFSFAAFVFLVYKDCKLRKDTGNAMKVFDLTSEALNECNVAIVHANCLPKKLPCKGSTAAVEKEEGGKAADVTVEVEGEEEKAPDRTVDLRPILTFPVYNFFILVAFLVLWCVVFVHLISLGSIEQKCKCAKSLSNCSCDRYFRFDDGARWFAIIHLYGLLWGVALVVNVSRVTISTAVSTWYFAEAKDLEVRVVPADLIRTSYRRALVYHSGSLLKASFYHPIVAVVRPLAFLFLKLRNMLSCVNRITFGFRGCLRSALLGCCCFQSIAYLDVRAAMQQIALRGSSFLRGAEVGTKLKMRNEGRVRGLEEAIEFKMMFGKTAIFCISFFVGFLYLRGSGNSGGSVGAPIIVLILNCIVAYATMSLFVSQYTMSIDTILQDFFEDCERNVRSTEVFMPPEFRKFIDDYGYYTSGTFPSDPTAMYTKLFKAKKLGVMHVPTKETMCHYVTTMDVCLHDKTAWPEEKEGWFIKCDRPLDHESQPRNTLEVFHKKYGRNILDNFTSLVKIPVTAKGLAGDGPWREGLKHIMWDQVRLPRRSAGYQRLNAMDPGEAIKRAANDPHASLIQQGQVKAFHGLCEKGLHEQYSPQQCLQYGWGSIALMVNMKTLRVARRLIDVEEDASVSCAPPAQLSAVERESYLADNGFDNEEFKDWCRANDLVMNKEKGLHPELSFAKDAFIFLHQNFYFFDSSRGWVPTKPVEVIKGDVGSSGTINNLYVAILRYNGVVARCLSGAWLWSNDGSYTAQGIQRGATEGEMLAMDFQRRTMSEFYLDGIGWVPTDATPTRLSSNNDPIARRARAKLGKYGWRKDLSMTCMANFGNDSGLLLLNTAGFEMGKPMVQFGPIGKPMGDVSLNAREFQCIDLAVSAYKPTKGFKDELYGAKEALTPVDPNDEKAQFKD